MTALAQLEALEDEQLAALGLLCHGPVEGCYLWHLETPLGNERHRAQHYLGYAEDLARRLVEHRAGQGASFTAAAVARGIRLYVVRLWIPGDRALESRLKRRRSSGNGSAPRLAEWCPICRPAYLAHQSAKMRRWRRRRREEARS